MNTRNIIVIFDFSMEKDVHRNDSRIWCKNSDKKYVAKT